MGAAGDGAGAWHIRAEDGELLGFVVIDRVVAGRACGGIRAGAHVTMDDIRRIARVMTFKCAFAGLAAGGAKGGVVVPAGWSAEKRRERLIAFGRAASDLLGAGVWSHGADMGTTDDDIALIRHAAGIGPAPRVGSTRPAGAAAKDASSGWSAGLTVALAAEAALAAIGRPLHEARVIVVGAGAVGRAAIRLLADQGARVVAVSTVAGAAIDPRGIEIAALLSGLAAHGDDFLAANAPASAALEAEADVMLLCAGSDVLDVARAQPLAVGAVICGANIPFTDEVAATLDARGILVVPDFVAGAGGVLGSTLVTACGASAAEIESLLRRHFKPLVAQTLADAVAHGTSADHEAMLRARRFIGACDAAYGRQQADSLLPVRLVRSEGWAMRQLLAVERRARPSRRLAAVARWLHGAAVRRAERVIAAAIAAGAGKSA